MSDQELIPEQKLTALLELEAEKVEESLDLWKLIEKQVTANQASNVPEPDDFQNIDTVPDSLETGRKILTFPRMLKYGLGIAAVLAIAFIIGTAIQPDKPDAGKDSFANAGPSKPPNTIPGTVALVPAATPSVRLLSASLKATLNGALAPVRAVAWKQDGTQVAAASDDANLITWDSNGKLLGNSGMPGINPPLGWPYRVIWLNNGIGFESGSAQVAAPNGKLTAYRVNESEFQLQKTIGSAAGETVAPLPTVAPGSTPQNNVLATLSVPGGVISQLAWSPDGKYIAASGQTAVPGGFGDIRVWVWKVDGTLAATIMNYHYPINSLAWSPDSHYLAIAAKGNNEAGVWSPDGTQIADFKGDFVIWDLAWSPDGLELAAASSDNTVRIYWNISWGGDAYKLTLAGHQDTVWAVAWSPDGRTLASGSADKTVRLWTVK